MNEVFDGLSGAIVSCVKAQVQYKHDPDTKHVLRFKNHSAFNEWLSSKSVRGRLRVTQLLIRYDYEDQD